MESDICKDKYNSTCFQTVPEGPESSTTTALYQVLQFNPSNSLTDLIFHTFQPISWRECPWTCVLFDMLFKSAFILERI